MFDEKLSRAGWRTPSTHWLSARSRPPVPTAIDLTNCCEQVSSRVASDRWCCSAWPRTGVPPPARLEAAEFDSPMGRPWPTTSSASLEGAQPRQPSNSRPEAPYHSSRSASVLPHRRGARRRTRAPAAGRHAVACVWVGRVHAARRAASGRRWEGERAPRARARAPRAAAPKASKRSGQHDM